jgi:hypothetical protein
MGKKSVLSQKDLNKMKPAEVLAISPDQLPPGFDVIHDQGKNPKLVEIEPANPVAEPFDIEKVAQEVSDGPEVNMPDKKEYPKSDVSNKGILFLRFFKQDPTNNKILTKLKGKVYFPKEQITEGWYIACVIDDFEKHGIMDTIALKDVNLTLWNSRYIKGIFTKRNYTTNELEIYPSVPREKLKEEEPPCIFRVNMPSTAETANKITIKDLIQSKEREALEGMFDGK